MIVLSLVAFMGAVLGWALASTRQTVYPIQGGYEHHG